MADVLPNVPPPTLVLCRDLLFASKIARLRSGECADQNDPHHFSVGHRRRIAADDVDLTQEGFIETAAAWKQKSGGHVTGFAGHADVETLERCAGGGIDRVIVAG